MKFFTKATLSALLLFALTPAYANDCVWRQSTAVDRSFGPFVDSTDGATAETGLTIANTDIRIKKGSAAWGNKASGGGTHEEDGWYEATFGTGDTDTVGPVQIQITVAGALQVWGSCLVVEEAVYDNFYAAASVGPLTAAATNTEADSAIETYHLDHLLAANYDPAAKPGTATALLNELIESDAGVSRYTINALEQAPSGSGASVAAIADGVWDELRSGHVTAGSFGQYVIADADLWNGVAITTALETSGDIADAVRGEPCGTETADTLGDLICNDVEAIIADTNELQGDDVPGLIAALPTDADVNTQADLALSDIHLDHLLATTYDPASEPGVSDALLNELTENDSGVARYTVNALEQAPSGSGASAATIADAVWDELQADHVIANSFGVIASEIASTLADTGELQTDDVPGLIAALNDLDAAGFRSAIGLATANLDTQLAALPTAAEIETELLAATIDGTISLQCALAIAVAYGSGDWDNPATTVTYRNPGDTADRIVGNLSATAFDATTITCP